MSLLEKNNQAKEFYDTYTLLNESGKDKFTRLCNKLMDENFVYGQHPSDKEDYYDILSNKNIISSFFNVIDISLVHDDERKIFYLESKESKTRVKFKKMESVLLLVLRILYYRKSREMDATTNISVGLDELVTEIVQTNIYPKIVKGNIIEALKVLKKYKLVNFDVKNLEINQVIVIYPTICIVVNNNDIQAMTVRLASYVNTTEEDENETDED